MKYFSSGSLTPCFSPDIFTAFKLLNSCLKSILSILNDETQNKCNKRGCLRHSSVLKKKCYQQKFDIQSYPISKLNLSKKIAKFAFLLREFAFFNMLMFLSFSKLFFKFQSLIHTFVIVY